MGTWAVFEVWYKIFTRWHCMCPYFLLDKYAVNHAQNYIPGFLSDFKTALKVLSKRNNRVNFKNTNIKKNKLS